MSSTRTFRVVSLKPFDELALKIKVTGSIPSKAAKKVLSAVAKHTGQKRPTQATVTLQEITRGSGRKVFTYIVKREKLPAPIVVEKEGVPITYQYHNKVKKVPSTHQ